MPEKVWFHKKTVFILLRFSPLHRSRRLTYPFLPSFQITLQLLGLLRFLFFFYDIHSNIPGFMSYRSFVRCLSYSSRRGEPLQSLCCNFCLMLGIPSTLKFLFWLISLRSVNFQLWIVPSSLGAPIITRCKGGIFKSVSNAAFGVVHIALVISLV